MIAQELLNLLFDQEYLFAAILVIAIGSLITCWRRLRRILEMKSTHD